MKILFVGDLVGEAALNALTRFMPGLIMERKADFCVVNGENAAGGLGLKAAQAEALFCAGFDAITLGNHCWSKPAMLSQIDEEPRILRPANGHPDWPGRGFTILSKGDMRLGVIDLMGQVFMDAPVSPFLEADRLLHLVRHRSLKHVLVDFHAEASSEKQALGRYLDGRVSAVCGTHTHVQTADERILPHGTAYITDLGMTGPTESVIGMRIETSLRRVVHKMPGRYELADGPLELRGAEIELDNESGRAVRIERLVFDLNGKHAAVR